MIDSFNLRKYCDNKEASPAIINSQNTSRDVTSQLVIMHIMDKLSVDGSKIHGPARQILYRLPYYDPNRYRVIMVNLRHEDTAATALQQSGIEVISLGRHKLDPRALWDIVRLIQMRRPSVLHLHGYAAWTFGRVAGQLSRLPVVIQEHMVAQKVPLIQQIPDWLLRNKQSTVLAVSSGVREFIVKRRYVQSDIEVILNGVPVDDYTAPLPAEVSALRENYRISRDARVVGIVGRLAEMKGHRYLLEAMATVCREIPETLLMIVGEGPLRESLAERAERLDLTERVLFTGYQSEIMAFLSLFDVAVVPSIFGEGFPGVSVEAFLAGTPLVIADLPNYGEGFFQHERNALLVPPANADALSKAILRLLNEPATAQTLVAGGRHCIQQCNTRAIAERYLRIYEELVASSYSWLSGQSWFT